MVKGRTGLVKWWKSHMRINGEITHIMSPFQQKVVSPLFHNWVKKGISRVTRNGPYVAPAFLGGIALYIWANKKHAELTDEHLRG